MTAAALSSNSISQRLLIGLRLTWGVVLLASLGLPLTHIDEAIRRLATPCTRQCPELYLSPGSLQSLQALGIQAYTFAALWVAINLVITVFWVGMGVLLFWRRSNDLTALLVSIFLLSIGTSFFQSDVTNLVPHGMIWRSVQATLYIVGNVAWALSFVLFPDGRLLSRWLIIVVVGYALVELVNQIALLLPSLPLRGAWLPNVLEVAAYVVMLGSQIYRYRRISTPLQRQQSKWVVFGLSMFLAMVGVIIGLSNAAPTIYRPGALGTFAIQPLLLVGFSVLPMSLAVAILRYRLWDIDFLISRTLVYGSLTAAVVGIYVVVVGYLGAVFRAQGNLLISLTATGIIAVLFQPLRFRLQRAVNRLVYGDRDDPYAVIMRLGQRLEATLSVETVLPTIVETVKEALKLPYAAITLRDHDEAHVVAEVGRPPGEAVRLPLTHQSEVIGELLLAPRAPGEMFTPADQRLLRVLVQQTGAAAHAVRLSSHLRQLSTDLQHSRGQLVLSREEERRRLRRDLHDGVGPTLASLAQRLDVARMLVPNDPQAAVVLLQDLKQQVKSTVGDVRQLVYALRPPALDQYGLVAALHEHIVRMEHSGVQVTLSAPPALPPLPAAVEVAAYRIVIEALTNVLRHAQAKSCHVDVALVHAGVRDILSVEIVDDGVGLPEAQQAGVGISSMRERAAELGGLCTISNQLQHGTRVSAELPMT